MLYGFLFEPKLDLNIVWYFWAHFARNSCPLTVLLLLLGAHISSMSVRLILLLNLCMIRMASIIYRGHLVLFGIDCAYPISARPLHDFGVFPEIHPYCTVGFCWVRLWLPTSSRTISRRRLSISVMIFRISFYDSKTSVRRI